VRPLCGQNLPATLPEREGWIQREQLFGFSGRWLIFIFLSNGMGMAFHTKTSKKINQSSMV
jgi:hypothetical protein